MNKSKIKSVKKLPLNYTTVKKVSKNLDISNPTVYPWIPAI